jgi:hypothetical protein
LLRWSKNNAFPKVEPLKTKQTKSDKMIHQLIL